MVVRCFDAERGLALVDTIIGTFSARLEPDGGVTIFRQFQWEPVGKLAALKEFLPWLKKHVASVVMARAVAKVAGAIGCTPKLLPGDSHE
jgi:hypothetical protein